MKLERPGTVLVFALLAVLFVIVLTPRALQVRKLKERSRGLEIELARLKKQNAVLENELTLLREDPVYLEKVAREKFNKAKGNEIVYKVVRPGDAAAETQGDPTGD
ncbi:MAG TPA: septum formation initiator family protein [Candidatus Eisenbacteria bacterium]|nr:septum formation initiator family protein [Candidatus Eisenbacteria bacterium]